MTAKGDLVRQLGGVLRRRVIPLLLIVVVALVLAARAWQTTPVRHNATGVVVVLPGAPSGDARINPLSRLTYDAQETASLAVTFMHSPVATRALDHVGASLVSADNAVDPTSPTLGRSTQVTFVVEGTSAAAALSGAEALIVATKQQLETFQADIGAPEAQRAELSTVIAPYSTASNRTNKLRATAGTLLGVLVVGAASLLAWDLLLSLLRRKSADDDARHPPRH